MRDRLAAHPWVGPLKPTAQRARHVEQPLRFFAREALRRRVGATYRLRRGPVVALRHGTPDLETFDQIFVQEALAPPAAVADVLPAAPRVLDLGANVGMSAAWFAALWPGARIVCVEPDPYNLEPLRVAAARGGWRVEEAAAAASEGTLTFAVGRVGTSREAAAGRAVRALDAFALAAEEDVDLWKVDIEGGEWALLADPRLGAIGARAIALEVHGHQCPGPDPKAVAREALEAAGFTVIETPHVAGAPADEASLWAHR